MSLKDRVGIITGASQGIGEAIAIELAMDKADVVLVDVQKEKLAGVAERINSSGGTASISCVDVSSFEQVQEAVEAIIKSHKKIDFLIFGKYFIF